MEINPLERKINASELPIDRLASNSALSQPEKIDAISRHFEAIFLRQILTEAQKPLLNPKDPMGSPANQIYRDMMVTHMAEEISKSGSFGLAQFYQTQLTPKHGSPNPGESSTAASEQGQ